jgi:hypothetical protein
MITPRRRPEGHLRLVSNSDGPATTVAGNTSVLSHTSRNGVTFYLHQGTTKTGKPKYYVAKTVGPGALAEMPAGFEFTESINGVVSIRRVDDSPRLITDYDVELVRNELAWHRHLRHYRVEATKVDIVIYEPAGALWAKRRYQPVMRFLTFSDQAGDIVIYEPAGALWAKRRYQPVMRFLTFSDQAGTYAVSRMTYRGEGRWSYPLAHGSLARLARDFVPSIGTNHFFELI